MNYTGNLLDVISLNSYYDLFLSMFPSQIHWFISLIVVLSIAAAFFVLIRFHWMMLFLLVIVLPIAIPALRNFFSELYFFVVYVWEKVGIVVSFKPPA